jgi:hypothetical protein
MKKIYLTAVFFVGMISFAFSQAELLKENHSLQAGDEHYFIIAENVASQKGGNNQVWDFSSLKQKGELHSHMLFNTEVEKSFDVPEANVVLEEYGTHFFFRVEENMMKHYGTITKNNTLIKYDKPFVKMVYPFNFGDSYSGEFSGELITKKNNRSFTGNYSISVDGKGKLILPGNITIKNVLRLKSVKEKKYENSDHVSRIVSYKWYCPEVRYPLLTIIQSENNEKTRTIKTAYYGNAENIEQNQQTENEKSSVNVKVYPNPFKEQIKAKYELKKNSDVQIAIFDNAGHKITEKNLKNQPKGVYTKTINTGGKDFSEGIYFIKIKTGQQIIKEKLIKIN